MKKIGRNNPCYCGSGKKYKNCCLNLKPSGSYMLSPGKSVDTYSEEDVVKQLISSSPAFKNYYETERESIGEILWIISNKDVELTSGFQKGQKGKALRYGKKTDIKKIIILEQIPPSLDDLFLVAHEMTHFLIAKKGFPSIAARLPNDLDDNEKQQRMHLASSMATMFHDPLCDSLLERYGIVYEDAYREYVLSVLEDRKNVEEPASNTYLAYIYAFQYVLTNLHNDTMVSDNVCLEKYNKFYESKFPNITEEGKFILDLIGISGYDTPEKLAFLYQDIINSMGLGAECKLEKT